MALSYEEHGKRFVDLVGAALALVALGPLMGVIAVAVKATSRGPALYRQTRIGANESSFTLLKFRSMPVDTPVMSSADGATLQPTRVGETIRRLNVDELPQLLNIMRGDMSLVGPRPALPSQIDLLDERTPEGSGRLRPGLTGLAQVKSYDGMPAREKASWDELYARDVSLRGDITIVSSTFRYLTKPPPKY